LGSRLRDASGVKTITGSLHLTEKDYTSQKEPPTLPEAPWKQDLLWGINGLRDYVDKNLEKLRERLAGAFAVGMSFAADDKEKHTAGK